MKRKMFILMMIVVSLLIGMPVFAAGSREVTPPAERIVLWTTEEQPERMDIQRAIAADFTNETGIEVDVVAVTESLIGERTTAAFAAGDLPDVIFHPLAYNYTWADAGILDTAASTEIVEQLGVDTFRSGVLNLVEFEGDYAGVPLSGWGQLVVYRSDLFEKNGLEPPTSYASLRKAIEFFHDPPNFYGIVAATDPSQEYMMQVFEHVALANGVDIVDEKGNVTLNTPQMRETLEFYKFLVEHSPPGDLYWQQSRELYHDGRAAVIIWSPFILHGLAGLRDGVPVTGFGPDPTTDKLAKLTGFSTTFAGPSNPQGAGWAEVGYMGITVDANTEAAKKFVLYTMEKAYMRTLGMAAVGKHPVRSGTLAEPTKYIDGWAEMEVGQDRWMPLNQIYDPDVIEDILSGLERGTRWGYEKGYGYVTSRLYETRVIAEVVREYLDNDITIDQALQIMQEETEKLL